MGPASYQAAPSRNNCRVRVAKLFAFGGFTDRCLYQFGYSSMLDCLVEEVGLEPTSCFRTLLVRSAVWTRLVENEGVEPSDLEPAFLSSELYLPVQLPKAPASRAAFISCAFECLCPTAFSKIGPPKRPEVANAR